jgi:hypothetical protein
MSCPMMQSVTLIFILWQAPCPKIYHEWGT